MAQNRVISGPPLLRVAQKCGLFGQILRLNSPPKCITPLNPRDPIALVTDLLQKYGQMALLDPPLSHSGMCLPQKAIYPPLSVSP